MIHIQKGNLGRPRQPRASHRHNVTRSGDLCPIWFSSDLSSVALKPRLDAIYPSHCPATATVHCTSPKEDERQASAQNTVPSLSISIGGPPVSGRFCLAISRPPFHVALSKIWARVSETSEAPPSLCRIRAAIRSLSIHQMSDFFPD